MRWRGWRRRWGSRARGRGSGWRSSIPRGCPALTPSSREGERESRPRPSSHRPEFGVVRAEPEQLRTRRLRQLLLDARDLVGRALVGVAGHVEALLGLVGRVARGGEPALELAALRLLAAALGLLAGSLGGLALLLLALALRRGALALLGRLAPTAALHRLPRCGGRRRRHESAHGPSTAA